MIPPLLPNERRWLNAFQEIPVNSGSAGIFLLVFLRQYVPLFASIDASIWNPIVDFPSKKFPLDGFDINSDSIIYEI